MDITDTSFPVRSVHTFDNTTYQEERKKARERHMQDLEEAFATATLLRSDPKEQEMSKSSSSSRGVFRRPVTDEATNITRSLSNTSSSSHHRRNNLAPQGIVLDTEKLDPPDREDFMEEIDFHDRSPLANGKDRRSASNCCVGFFYSLVGAIGLVMEFGIACWGARTSGQRKVLVLCCVLVPLVVIATVITVLVTGGSGGSNGDVVQFPPLQGSDEEPKNQARFDAIRELVLQVSGSTELDLVGSPSNMAVRWLSDYDGAQVDPSHPVLLQRYALAVLFFSSQIFQEKEEESGMGTIIIPATKWTNGQHWLSSKGICDWYGVSCPAIQHDGMYYVQYNQNADVLALNLTENNLSGEIPSEVQALTKLQSLDMSHNNMILNMPTGLGQLRDLATLNLRENKLTGMVPSELGHLREMKGLDVGWNLLNGPVPTELTKLKKLESLALNHNALNGTLPDYRKLGELVTLQLQSNKFVGTILGHLETLAHLIDLRLDHNKLVGTVPASVFKMPKLQILYVSYNRLTGTLPDRFDHTKHLQEVMMERNKLTGTLPTTLASLDVLRVLYLNDNKFNGTIPAEFGSGMDELEELYLYDNSKLSGTLPTTIGELQNLKALRIYRTRLSGPIPPEIGNATSLQVLSLHHNLLNGTIPTTMGLLKNLTNFRFFGNHLVGTVPEEVCNLRSTNAGSLTFLAGDCSLENGTIECDCCHECYPQ